MTGANEQLRVGVHERHGHRDVGAVRKHELRPRAEALDDGEDVVPAAGVEPGGVIAQLVQDGVHLECRRHRLDQHRGLDRPALQAELVLGDQEGVAPERRLVVRLQLGDVEVRAESALEQHLGVAMHVQAEVHERARHVIAVHLQVALGQVQPARPHQQHRVVGLEAVVLALLLMLHRPARRVGEVHLTADHVGPVGRVRVLEVGHEPARARVEGVDDHLARRRPGDLDAPVRQRARNGRDREVLGGSHEVQLAAGVELGLARLAGAQQLPAAAVELLVQPADESEPVVRQNFVPALLDVRPDLDHHALVSFL
jgi:hypothetical protein